MQHLTYRELREQLASMEDENLDQTVTVYISSIEEFHPIVDLTFTVGDDVLDDNHAILSVA